MTVDEATHRRLAVELFGRSWRLLELRSAQPSKADPRRSRLVLPLARAHLAAGNRAEAERYAGLARDELAGIEDPDDRQVIAGQLAELALDS